jgi:ABC-type dipeptide/oligopeptide/nickel transport system permease component
MGKHNYLKEIWMGSICGTVLCGCSIILLAYVYGLILGVIAYCLKYHGIKNLSGRLSFILYAALVFFLLC